MNKKITIYLGKSKIKMDTDVLLEPDYEQEVEKFIKDFNDDNRTNYKIIKIEGNKFFTRNNEESSKGKHIFQNDREECRNS